MGRIIKNLEYSRINTILFKLLLSAVFLTAAFYVYFVSVAVNEIVESKENFKNAQTIRQEYQSLEGYYFNLLGKFDSDYSNSLGLVDGGKNVKYAIRQTTFARR